MARHDPAAKRASVRAPPNASSRANGVDSAVAAEISVAAPSRARRTSSRIAPFGISSGPRVAGTASRGARAGSVAPTPVRKSRAGDLGKVVGDPAAAGAVARRLAEGTGTLGVREGSARHRWVADRAFETATLTVEGETYDVAVKVGSDADGAVFDVSAEYDDALAVAHETDLPVREVLRRAEAAVADGSE